jgi:hypothetical protein
MCSNVVRCGLLHTDVIKCARMWSNGVEYGRNVVRCLQVWSEVIKCGRMWSNVVQRWSDIFKYGQKWISCAKMWSKVVDYGQYVIRGFQIRSKVINLVKCGRMWSDVSSLVRSGSNVLRCGRMSICSFVQYSALLHLPPLRFHCADGCWDRTQDRCNLCIGSQTL